MSPEWYGMSEIDRLSICTCQEIWYEGITNTATHLTWQIERRLPQPSVSGCGIFEWVGNFQKVTYQQNFDRLALLGTYNVTSVWFQSITSTFGGAGTTFVNSLLAHRACHFGGNIPPKVISYFSTTWHLHLQAILFTSCLSFYKQLPFRVVPLFRGRVGATTFQGVCTSLKIVCWYFTFPLSCCSILLQYSVCIVIGVHCTASLDCDNTIYLGTQCNVTVLPH